MIVKDNQKYFWHIDFPEEVNFAEAFFIDSIIRFYSIKHNVRLKSILDVPCGTGRLHKYLRNFGYDVYGLDINKNFIQEAKSNYKNYSSKYFIGDMKNFKLNMKFDVILNWFTSFGYFEHKDNIKTLKNFADHLTDIGIIIIDYMIYQREGYHILDHGKYVEILKIKFNNGRYIFSSKLYRKTEDNLEFEDSFEISYIPYSIEDISNIADTIDLRVKYVFPNLSLIPLKKYSDRELGRKRIDRITLILSK